MDWHIVVVTLLFIVMDIATGFAQAVSTKTLDSSEMRDGLWHKSGFIGVMLLAALGEFAMGYLDLGFEVPLFIPVCVFICVTEVVSIFENLCKLSPELANSKLAALFNIKVK